MSAFLIFILSLSIGFPVITSLIRFKVASKDIHFLIIYFILGFLNECLYYFSGSAQISNLGSNIFLIFEFSLLLFQLKHWGLYQQKNRFICMLILGLIMYILSLVYFKTIFEFNSIFIIFSNFTIVLGCIDQVNKQFIESDIPLLKNHRVIISFSLILFFSMCILVESFFIFNLKLSADFLHHVFTIKIFLNLIIHLVIALAILWIPKKKIFM
ncbi:MAG: hypothetical protein KA198_08530 [Chitinophagaceae bacterium]|nr:hypothetical protein [Chitinophagaceae bacterium]